MKKLMMSISFIIVMVTAPAALGSQEPIDLVEMREAGLSNETLGRYLAQNLGNSRLAPPVDANLLTRLGRYGGDALARAYLDLDRQTAQLPAREFSPEVVDQLMAGGLEPGELTRLLNQETARYAAGQAQAVSPAPSAGDPAPSVGATQAPIAPQAAAAPIAPRATAPVSSPPRAPAATVPAAPAPAAPRAAFQQLRPGQAADPGSPLPLPYSTYDIRNNRGDGQVRAGRNSGGPWMGVRERELPDGHLAEVHTNGDPAFLGQEVYTRPSGHQVYRYFSGNPDQPRSGADPRQEQRNREDLSIIFQGGN